MRGRIADYSRLARILLLCHAKTVDLYRREFQPEQKGTIGITYVSPPRRCCLEIRLMSRTATGLSPLIRLWKQKKQLKVSDTTC